MIELFLSSRSDGVRTRAGEGEVALQPRSILADPYHGHQFVNAFPSNVTASKTPIIRNPHEELKLIELFTWSTSNGRKVSIALEEMGVDYIVRPVDIYRGDQFENAFSVITPNNKIPVIRDDEITIFESGAILLYLAEKTRRFLPVDAKERWETIQWLMWQMGGLGPILGQAAHFLHYKPGQSDYSADRFGTEAKRLYAVLDAHLEQRDFMTAVYSIADMAIWPWVSRYEHQQINLTDYPNVLRWYAGIARRPAVQKGYKVPDQSVEIPIPA